MPSQNLSEFVKNSCEKNSIRILEMGGRTGGLTWRICNLLKHEDLAKSVEYVFTDLSNSLFKKAQSNLQEFDFICYQPFHPETGLLGQDLHLESFDLIINLNTIHALSSLEGCMENLKSLLCDGGALLCLEATNDCNVFDLWSGALEVCWASNEVRMMQCYEKHECCWVYRHRDLFHTQ